MIELTRYMYGKKLVQVVDYSTYVQWTQNSIFSFSARIV